MWANAAAGATAAGAGAPSGAERLGGIGGPNAGPNAQEAEAQRKAAEERRAQMVQLLLEPAALERLERVRLVKPDRARLAEEYVLRLGPRGGGRIDEDELKGLLERLGEAAAGAPGAAAGGGAAGSAAAAAGRTSRIKFVRKRGLSDSEDGF